MNQKKKIMILGGGPNRIGQGIEFDYTCVHAAYELRENNIKSIMVNCNPETVSTDYDTSDTLYFEPLTLEDVLNIYEKEQPDGIIVQFGGQTPLNIAAELEEEGVKILGTSPKSIDLAEDRECFNSMMEKLGVPQPESGIATSIDEAIEIVNKIGYPVMVRPSYVLGGRGMEIVYDEKTLKNYVANAVVISNEKPILLDKFLENAIEVEVDAISDGEEVFLPAIMEHIEYAGIHSGDSACVIPTRNISEKNITILEDYTKKIALAFNVVGLMNIQYAIYDDKVYILEANPRASRTVPFVSKVTGIPMAKIATQMLIGKKLKDVLPEEKPKFQHFGIKEAVFPFNMFPEVDPLLGPEMRSTGEVLGIDDSFGMAYYKAQQAVGFKLPLKGNVLVSVTNKDKNFLLKPAKKLTEMGFNIFATKGTHAFLEENNIEASSIFKMHEGRPNIDDLIKNHELHLIINTPIGREGKYDDSYIRNTAIKYKVPYITTMVAAEAAVEGIEAAIKRNSTVSSLQEYHNATK